VVSVIGCTGDWTGGWDNVEPEGPDRFIAADLKSGRMVDVISRGEPAMMVCHWTGIHWNGEEKGFKVFQEVVRRLHARFDNLIWMKLSELSRYWAAKELTRIESGERGVDFRAPFACPEFTVSLNRHLQAEPAVTVGNSTVSLDRVSTLNHLQRNTWCRKDQSTVFCFDLPKGRSSLNWS
jgi:hypothetical protein